MRWLVLPAGVEAVALITIVYVAFFGASSPLPTATPPPAATHTPTPAAGAAATGPPQVEAGGPIFEQTGGPPAREAKVVYMGRRDVPAVALTFDVGVQAAHVPEILDVLKEHGKRATFGITGEWAETNPALLKRMVKEKHAIVNHSWSHTSFTGEATETEPLTADQIRDELERTEKKIQQIAKVSTKPYFRPPYGDFDPTVNEVAREAGYKYNVLWLVDGMGWEGYSTSYVVNVTMANAYNGVIFLYHTDNPRDYRALEEIIEGLDERGLQIVTIPQLLGKRPIPSPTPRPSPTAAPSPTPTPRSSRTLTLIAAPTPKPASEPTPAATPAGPPAPTPNPTPTANATPTAIPTPTPAPYVTLAFDGFESGGADGSSGWLGPWQSSDSFLVSSEAPHTGDWALDPASGISVYREANLAANEKVHLRFWSRLSRLDESRRAFVLVRPGGGLGWEVVKGFTMAESDGIYHLYDIDLTAYEMSETFAVGFYSQLNTLTDQWYIDDVELVTVAP